MLLDASVKQTDSSSWVHAGTPRRRTGDKEINSQKSGVGRAVRTDNPSQVISIPAPSSPSNGKPEYKLLRGLRAARAPVSARHILQAVSKAFPVSGSATFDYRLAQELTKVPGLTETWIQFVTDLVTLDPGREQGAPSSPSQKLRAPYSRPQDPGGPLPCPVSHTSAGLI